MTEFSRRWPFWAALLLILLLAFALRIFKLDQVPLRGDEAYTAVHGTLTPFSDDWMEMIKTQPNPGMLVTYWAWTRLAGLSEFALRYIALVSNVLGLAVMLALVHRLQKDWRLALLVGLLWALNPFFIWHAQDARHYAFTTLLTPLSYLLFVNALEKDRPRDWLAYLLLQTLALYVNIIDVYWMLAQGLLLLSLRRIALFRRAVLVWLVMGLLLIPLAAQVYAVRVVNSYEGTGGAADLAVLFEDFVATLLFGDNRWPLLAGLLVLLVLALGLLAFGRRRVLLLGWLLLPFLLLYVFSTGTNIFLPRYVVQNSAILMFALVLTAQGLGEMLTKRWHLARWLPLLAVLVVGGLSLIEIRDYFFNDTPKAADWRGLATYLDERTGADDLILSDSIDPALEYYYEGAAEILFIPADDPDPLLYMPQALAEHQAIFVLAGERTGGAARYLQDQAQAIPGDDWPGVSQFRAWEVAPGEIAQPLDLQMADVAVLRGYTLVGDTSLLLYWEALSQTETETSVLLHISSTPDAPPFATLDHALAGALVSTRTWSPGTLYRDPVALPSLPPGTYNLLVGMYRADNQEPLLPGGDDEASPRTVIGSFTVR